MRTLTADAFPRAAGGFSVIVGSLVLVGWALDLPTLKSVLPGLVTMKANTAVAFALCGLSLCLARENGSPRGRLWLRRMSALAAGLIGFATLCEYLSGLDLGIDQLLFMEPAGAAGTSQPGRMAPATAASFFSLGAALYFLSPALALPALLLPALALLGYAYGVESFYGFGAYTSMAVHTAPTFLVVVAGLWRAVPEAWPMDVLLSDTSSGALLRRLLPAAVLTPFILGWLALQGDQAGFYDSRYGLTLFSLATMGTFSVLVLWNSAALFREEAGRRRAEEEVRGLNEMLARRAEQLAAASQAKSQFLANISHELRSPLNAVIGYSDLLLQGKEGPLQEEQREDLRIIALNARNLLGLINELIDQAKIESGKVDLFPEILSLGELLEGIRSSFAREAGRKGLSLEILSKGPDRLRADRQRLRQALTNLVQNALKFTRQGGVSLGAEERESEVVISVSDTGPGIPAHELETVFERFQQSKSLEKVKKGEGMGLGLHLARHFIELHGGRMWVQSREGKGTTFFAALPLQ